MSEHIPTKLKRLFKRKSWVEEYSAQMAEKKGGKK